MGQLARVAHHREHHSRLDMYGGCIRGPTSVHLVDVARYCQGQVVLLLLCKEVSDGWNNRQRKWDLDASNRAGHRSEGGDIDGLRLD